MMKCSHGTHYVDRCTYWNSMTHQLVKLYVTRTDDCHVIKILFHNANLKIFGSLREQRFEK